MDCSRAFDFHSFHCSQILTFSSSIIIIIIRMVCRHRVLSYIHCRLETKGIFSFSAVDLINGNWKTTIHRTEIGWKGHHQPILSVLYAQVFSIYIKEAYFTATLSHSNPTDEWKQSAFEALKSSIETHKIVQSLTPIWDLQRFFSSKINVNWMRMFTCVINRPQNIATVINSNFMQWMFSFA